MKNKKVEENYWETETGETIFFEKGFMRYFEKAGKLQFGKAKKTDDGLKLYVSFVLDRENLVNSPEGLPYLMQVLTEWRDGVDN